MVMLLWVALSFLFISAEVDSTPRLISVFVFLFSLFNSLGTGLIPVRSRSKYNFLLHYFMRP